MNILIDTNVLLRERQTESNQHQQARNALRELIVQGHTLIVTPQILAEFWNVCTRPPKNNGLGMETSDVTKILENVMQIFSLHRDKPEAFDHWLDIIKKNDVKGVQVHDARLVAAMIAYGITHILTFNTKDFKRFQGITIIDPKDIGLP